jgi:uncharacterized beta-barrel protein YwiB (DUF1934 family)
LDTKDITLKIIGKQIYDGKEEVTMEFVTEGKFYNREKNCYVVYEESELSGMEGCKTTLKVGDGNVMMRRFGQQGYRSELFFEEGRRFASTYETPYGPMDVEVLTESVACDLDRENGSGHIRINYDVSLEGLGEGKNEIRIDINDISQ